MRLKPHEAQNYRKKALWVSWLSIVVTLILAVTAFSKQAFQHFLCRAREEPEYIAGRRGDNADEGDFGFRFLTTKRMSS